MDTLISYYIMILFLYLSLLLFGLWSSSSSQNHYQVFLNVISFSVGNKPWFHWCNDTSSSFLDWIVNADDDDMNQTTLHDDDGPPRENCPRIWGHHPFQRETFPCWWAEWEKDVNVETSRIGKYYNAERSQIILSCNVIMPIKIHNFIRFTIRQHSITHLQYLE